MALFNKKGTVDAPVITLVKDGKIHPLFIKARNNFNHDKFEIDDDLTISLEDVYQQIYAANGEVLSSQLTSVKLDNSASGQQGVSILLTYRCK